MTEKNQNQSRPQRPQGILPGMGGVARKAACTRTPARELELEMLGKLSRAKVAVRIVDLFDGFSPTWAVNAAARLVERGEATRDRDGKYAATRAGLEAVGAANGATGKPGGRTDAA